MTLFKPKKGTMTNTGADKVFYVVDYLVLIAVFLLVLYPLVYVVSSSFSDAQAVLQGRVWLLPIEPTLDGYRAVFNYEPVWIGYANSIYYTVLGTFINLAMTLLVSYPLSRKDFIGRDAVMFLFMLTMFFSGGLIPTYLLIQSLGIINTRWVMVLHSALGVWNVVICRTFLQSTIPSELYDSSKVDGASNTRVFFSIVLPLSGPIIAVMALFYGVNHWNSYFAALLYLRDRAMRPLQIVLREVLILNSPNLLRESMGSMSPEQLERMTERQYLAGLLQYALIVVATVPMLAIYPIVQRHFVRGVMIGAVKG